ncbi:ankyrin repeat and sterile alpha motif domain-containing protein 1B-like isoform X2 [Chironomus tepperi]|uniref:ankyrin repeat and sterile alpha motif domain-containing protein 1B-like isoform X2 n=1 Tax=Chironomus tepperi TaxID=113505 RepID=UPI00391F7048
MSKKSNKNENKKYLRRGVGVNTQDSSGYNALHHAALNGHTDVVHLLLSHDNINPNALDQRGSSPLHLASWAGHTDICKLLLKHPTLPADPNCRTAEDETPLHFAAQHGHLTAIIELLAHGGDPNIVNVRDETPLDLAAQYGRLQVVQILIRAHNELLLPLKATSTPQYHTALHLASRNGHRDVVELLLAAGCNVNILTPNGSALHESAMTGKEKVVKALLKEGIDLDLTDRDGRTVFDLLDEFPAHVVHRIRTVINNYRKSTVYDNSDTDDLREVDRHPRRGTGPGYQESRGGSSLNRSKLRYQQPQPPNHRYQDHYDYGGTTSPSSSMGSFGGGISPTPPHHAGSIVKITPLPRNVPSKPPRKSQSISPPTHPQTLYHISRSFDKDYDIDYSVKDSSNDHDCSSSTSSNHHNNNNNNSSYNKNQKSNKTGKGNPSTAYEYLHLTRTGEQKSESDYIMMTAPITIPADYDKKIVRVANPHRKLRRPKDGYSPENDTFVQVRRNPNEPPLSPTHYPQASTPEHAPPSAEQAEHCIIATIRPLSQEYKRCSGKLDFNKSPASASSGSLSSVSLSSSTDCVEEYHGDAPFAGLFKGSTMTLNNPNSTFTTHLSTFTQHLQHKDDPSRTHMTTTTTTSSINNNNHADEVNVERNVNLMSPFDEQEEWAKISEIMESFGSGIARESVFVNDIENEFRQRLGLKDFKCENGSDGKGVEDAIPEVDENLTPLKKWLVDINLEHLEEQLNENGYDNLDYLNGLITNENDLEICGISEKDRHVLLNEILKLPKPPTLLESNKNNKLNNNQHPILTADQWLASIHLDEYVDVFKKHLYIDMEKIYTIWDIELQAVLEINKIGHRKRILYSLIGQRLEPPNIEEINEDTCSNNALDINNDESSDNNNQPKKVKPTPVARSASSSRHKKNRMAPQPPVRANNLEIRSPSELLLSNQGSMQATWKHSAAALIAGTIRYEVFYLGSTIIKELRGTESTRKSILKLKKGALMTSSSPSHSSLIQNVKRPVCLAISHLGVQFIDIDSQGVICEHSVKNIDCACQDAEDLSHFAYITKDFENNIHYCHVFNVDSMELATEIILTLGQAFEVAYQLALRETSSTPSSAGINGKRPMSLASTTSTSDNG